MATMIFIRWARTARKAAKAKTAMSRTGSPGFTLVELLVVLLILGFVIFLAPPLFQRAVPALEIKAAARILSAAFSQGRILAIRKNREIPVIVDLDARTVRVGVEQYPTQLSRRL